MTKRKPYEPDDRTEKILGRKLARALWTTYETLPDDEDESLLRLAFLKERASWRNFLDQSWDTVIEADRSNSELIAAHPKGAPPDSAADPRGYWPRVKKNDDILRAFVRRCRDEFEIQDRTLVATVYAHTEVGYGIHDRIILSAEALSVLDPAANEGSISERAKRDVLPRLFFSYGIRQLPPSSDGGLWPVGWDPSLKSRPEPHERILKVNLSKKRAQLEAEFAAFLDHEEASHNAPFDRSRFRDKAWTHLKVWRLRRQIPKPSFPEIAKKLRITPAAAKKSFYRAFEIIYGKRFDLKAWEKDRAEKPSKTCANCTQQEECIARGEACPEIFEEKTSTREYLAENIAEIDVSHSYNEWLTREGKNEP
jgi:hypothetical protein